MKNAIKISIILIILINIFTIGILSAIAETTIIGKADCSKVNCSTGGKTDNGKICCGNYELNDFARIAIKVAEIILGIVGSLSLLAFVAGGLMMMLSAGNPEWVTRGKQTLIGAVIGLAIVFTSYMIIQLVFTSLGIKGTWSSSDWFSKQSPTINTPPVN